MSREKIVMYLFLTTIMISLVFLVYTSYVYFNTYTLSSELQLSIEEFNVTAQESSILVRTVLLFGNPSNLQLKITHVHEELYADLGHTYLLGDSYVRPLAGDDYVLLVSPFSNETTTINITIDALEGSITEWFIVLKIRIMDVPFVEKLYLTRYLTWPA
jgi:hypothetical protein